MSKTARMYAHLLRNLPAEVRSAALRALCKAGEQGVRRVQCHLHLMDLLREHPEMAPSRQESRDVQEQAAE